MLVDAVGVSNVVKVMHRGFGEEKAEGEGMNWGIAWA